MSQVPPFTEPDHTSHGDREITARWVLGVADIHGWQPQAVLSVRHFKGHGYRATLNTAQVRTAPEIWEEESSPLRSMVVHDVRSTARFSRAGLGSAYQASVVELRRRASAGEPSVLAYFRSRPDGAVQADEPARRSPHAIVPSVVDNLVDGDVFSVDGGTTWYVCAVVLYGVVAVYTTPRRGDDAPTIRVEADRDAPCLLITT